MVSFLFKAKNYFILVVMITAFAVVVKHQFNQISVQKKLISTLEYHGDQYIKTITRMKTLQGKKNKVFKEYHEKQYKINQYFDDIRTTLNENNENINWDDKKIPDSIICIINCMQQQYKDGACNCS